MSEGGREKGKFKMTQAYLSSSYFSIVTTGSDAIEKACDCLLRVAHKVGHFRLKSSVPTEYFTVQKRALKHTLLREKVTSMYGYDRETKIMQHARFITSIDCMRQR